jgi:putative redox protein
MHLKRSVQRGGDARNRPDDLRVVVRGDFSGDPAVSEPVSYDVELAGAATTEELEQLVAHVDAIAEIPNSVRHGTDIQLAAVKAVSTRA